MLWLWCVLTRGAETVLVGSAVVPRLSGRGGRQWGHLPRDRGHGSWPCTTGGKNRSEWAGSAAPVSVQLVEDVVDDAQFAAQPQLLIHEAADHEVEDIETERREHQRSVGGHAGRAGRHLGQSGGQELPAPSALFDQLWRGVRLRTVLAVVDGVRGGQR
jgi:hypothetical protein